MELVVLLEFDAPAPEIRQALLDRIGALALTGQGRLSFVATERDEQGRPAREVIAVGLQSAPGFVSLVARWRSEGALPDGVSVRPLDVEPIWQAEPLALMFP